MCFYVFSAFESGITVSSPPMRSIRPLPHSTAMRSRHNWMEHVANRTLFDMYVPHPKACDVSFTPDGAFLAVVERKVLGTKFQLNFATCLPSHPRLPPGFHRFSVHFLQCHRLGARQANAAAHPRLQRLLMVARRHHGCGVGLCLGVQVGRASRSPRRVELLLRHSRYPHQPPYS